MWATKYLTAILIVTLSVFMAATPSIAKQQRFYGFEHFDHNKTLTSQSIVSVAQDKYGFLWFGTEDASVFRFDGLVFQHYSHNPNSSQSIAPGRVYAILADSHGFVWFATAGSGVSQYNPDTNTFQTFRHNSKNPESIGNDVVRSFIEDHEGNIWMGTSNGISIFNYATQTFSHIKVGDNALPKGDIWHMYQDQFNHVWIATYGGGLAEYDPNTQKFIYYKHNSQDKNSLAHNIVGAIIEDREGNIWVGGKGGLNKLNRQTRNFTHFKHDPNNPHSLLENYVWDLHLDDRGFLWVAGFGGGLARFDPQTHQVTRHSHDPNQVNSLSSNLVFFVFQDRSDVLWVGTSNAGLNKYALARDRFESYLSYKNEDGNFPIIDIISLFQTQDGLIWLGGTEPKGGIAAWDVMTNHITHLPYLESNVKGIPNGLIYDFVEDQQGFLWFTGGVTAVKRLNRKTGEVTRYQPNSKNSNSILHNIANSLFVDKLDNIWICTMGGVSKLDKTRSHFTHYLKGKQCDTVYIDSFDNLWIGTRSDGVYYFENGQSEAVNFRHNKLEKNSLSGDFVTYIFESEDKEIWLGTMGSGLNLWRADSRDFISFDVNDGLSDNSISTIREDSLGRLWVATSNGLSVLDKRDHHFTNFYVKDGLTSNSFDNISNVSSLKGMDGYLYFANGNGVVKLKPESVLANTKLPPVVITQVQIANKPAQLASSYWHAREIVLDWQDRMLSFSFSVLDFNNPEQNKISYMLEGFDKNWIEPSGERRAVYTNLDGGDYIFKVKAANNHGLWSESPIEVNVRVVPPWWETIYAMMVYMLVIAISIRWFIHIKVQKKQQELAVVSAMNKKLEQQVSERTAHLNRAIEDLNKNKKFLVEAEKMLSMGRLVTGVAHEINTPLGIGITSASALDGELSHLKNKMDSNELSRNDLESRLITMKEFTDLLADSLESAAKLIKRFKRISIGEVSEEFQACHVFDLIQDVKKMIAGEYSVRDIQWHIQCNEHLVIKSSAYAIYTLLENLASNIVKHAYLIEDVIEITINVEYFNNLNRLRISVEDNGKGINKENLSKIFDPFYTSSRGNDCTGLGLHIVYNEVTQRLAGVIECHSEVGVGSRFIVEFPAQTIPL